MGSFLAELRRRHIFRIGAVYVVVAWGIIQVLDVLSQLFALPDWIAQPAVVVLAIGFPVALILAWMIVGAADGGDPARSLKATATDWLIGGGLIAVLLAIGYQQYASAPRQATGVEAAREAASSPETAVALAVLPFANLSTDPSQQFFSDGITEEISYALAKIPDLRVVARNSAFQFREEDRDIQTIGEVLRATHLIDGSVRQEGERVRITARLIESNESTLLWAENYDRELTNVIDVQEEIATAIASALGMQLGLAPGGQLLTSRNIDPDSYSQYLQARALYRTRALDEAIPLLRSVVANNPNYAPAWATLTFALGISGARVNLGVEGREALIDSLREESRLAAAEALRLDPNDPNVIAAQAFVAAEIRNPIESRRLYTRALRIDPTNPDLLDRYSQFLQVTGRTSEALQIMDELTALEPLVPTYQVFRNQALLDRGSNEEALEVLESTYIEDPGNHFLQHIAISKAYAELGRYDEAANALLNVRAELVPRETIEEAARLLRLPRPVTPPSDTPNLPGRLDFVFVHLGNYEPVINRIASGSSYFQLNGFWSPWFAPVREADPFKDYVRDSGLFDYWHEFGFADLCRPVGDNDFECD